jgi:uncharacterized membrane protein HdeD (DUF308 family)
MLIANVVSAHAAAPASSAVSATVYYGTIVVLCGTLVVFVSLLGDKEWDWTQNTNIVCTLLIGVGVAVGFGEQLADYVGENGDEVYAIPGALLLVAIGPAYSFLRARCRTK